MVRAGSTKFPIPGPLSKQVKRVSSIIPWSTVSEDSQNYGMPGLASLNLRGLDTG